MKQFDSLYKAGKAGLLTYLLLAFGMSASAQTTINISSGTDIFNSGVAYTISGSLGAANTFVNNGSYTDTTSPGAFNVNGPFAFSGSGTTLSYNFNINSGLSVLSSQVSVYNTATVNSGDSLDAGAGNLFIRTDIAPHYTTANLVVNGVLTGTVNGLVTYSTATPGCSGYTPTLSSNISGSVVAYQWESSPDNSSWTTVAGATNATYVPTVTATVYYHVIATTTNSSYSGTTASVQLTVTPPPAIITGTPVVCVGATTTLADATTGGIWSASNANVTVGSTSGIVTGVTSGTVTVTYSNTCAPDATIDVTVNALPTVSAGSDVTICSGNGTTLSASGSAASYTWAPPTNLSATTGASVTASPSVTTTYTVTGTDGVTGCTNTSAVQVSVNPTPVMTVTPTSQTVCNNANTSTEVFTSNVTGTTYTWNNNNITIGIGASGSGSAISSFTATNTGTTPISGVFTVSPTANSCPGAAQTFTVNVNPTPVLTVTPTSQTVCNNTNTSTEVFTSSVTGTTYTWNNSNAAIGIGLSGSGSSIASFTATNTGTAPISGVFTVTPTANSCQGAVQTFTVNVNPTPIMTVTPTSQTVCNNANTSTIVFTSSVTGTTYTWNNNNITIGIGASGSGSAIASFTATNSGTVTTTGVFTVTPTANTCAGPVQTFTVNVNPTPVITGTLDVCVGLTTTLNAIPAGGTWSSPSGNVTVGSSTGVVTGVTAGTAVISYTAGGCVSTVTVTVTNTPGTITGTFTVCESATTTLNCTPAGGNWTSSNANATVGSTTGVVTGVTAGTSTISYSFGPGCNATQNVTVNPLPGPIGGFAVSTIFSFTGSIQSYTVPAGITSLNISASGAQGGSGSTAPATGGLGANMSGVFTVTPGHVLNILTGQHSALANIQGGGGGGSFVWDVTAGNVLLIAAGGGGGSGYNGPSNNGINAVTTLNGTNSGGGFGGAGTGGNGGVVPSLGGNGYAGGGTGWLTNGAAGNDFGLCSGSAGGGHTPLTGGAGGVVGGTPISSGGGFGGGGGAQGWCGFGGGGGGGGYSGGGGGYFSASVGNAGGGGGSFNGGTSQVNTVGNTGNGVVTISYSLPPIICVGATNTLSATPSGGSWSGSNANVTIGSSTGAVTGVTAGTTDITYTLPAGCFTTTTVTINATPSVSVGTNTTICPGTPTALTASGTATSYTWSPGTSLSATTGTSVTASPTVTTTYTVTGTNAAGCSSTATVIVTVLHPTVVSTTGNATCFGVSSSVSAIPSAGALIQWYDLAAGGTLLGSGNILSITTPTVSASYFATALTTISPSSSLLTTFGGLSFVSPAGGNIFDIDVLNPLAIHSFDVNTHAGTSNWFIYMRSGTAVGFTGTSAGWSLMATFSGVTSSGVHNFALPTQIALAPGTYGVYIVSDNAATLYTPTGTGVGNVIVSNADLDIKEGYASGYLFGTAFSPRIANVKINYSTAFTCPSSPRSVAALTVNPLPTPSFTAQPGANACASTNVVYTTQSGMTGYVWGFPGTAGVDYVIVSGGTGASNTATLQYHTPGAKTVTINYTDANGCTAVSATSSTPTTIQMGPTITAVSPLVSIPGTSVSVTGTNFDATPANDIVYFGGVQAVVTSASTTSLNVTVPKGARFDYVIVENTAACGLLAYALAPFLQDYSNAAYINTTVNFDPTVNFGTGTTPYNVTVGDIDGDGKPDIVVANQSSGSISVLRNTSTSGSISAASFSAKVDFTTGGNPQVVKLADVDGDGKLDVIAACATTNVIAVFKNTATSGIINSGSLASPVTFAIGSFVTGMAITDMDGDGKSDVLVANFSSGTISILRNTSVTGSITAGSFAAKVDFSAGGIGVGGIAVGDLDGDGRPDVATPDFSAASASVWRNTAVPGIINAGSLSARVDFAAGTQPAGIAIGDVDGDGKLDLVIANQGSANISVLRNTATSGTITTASFTAAVNFTTGSQPIGVSIGDINGDGKPDIAVANAASSNASVFINTAVSGSITSASLSGKIDFGSGSSPRGIVISDMDGDNLPDLVVGNQFANNVSVLRNDPLHPITGPTAVCAHGSTITLSNTTPNGKWISSNTSIATVGSSTGIVTGVNVGAVTITYAGTANSGPALGNYTVYGVTVNGPQIAPSNNSPVCVGGLISLAANNTGTGSFTYAWSGPASFTSGGASPGISGAALANAGTYTVTAISGTGCTQSLTTTVTVNPAPTTAPTNTSPACAGGTINFNAVATATGTLTYSWTGPTGFTSASATPSLSGVTSANAGTYVVTVSTPGSGCITSATTIVTINPTPTAAPTNTGPICTGSLAIIRANATAGSGVTGYSWSDGAGFTSSIANPIVSPTVTTTYSLTVTGPTGSGCSPATVYTTTVVVNTPPTAITGSLTYCVGNTATLVSTPATGVWTSSNATMATIGSSTGLVTALSAGTPTIKYTMGTGCVVLQQITVNPLPAAITGTLGICSGATTTLANATAGGTWSSNATATANIGSSTGVVTGGTAGNAAISYTLSTGCFAIAPFTVNTTPTAITGTLNVCVGNTTALSTSPGGGLWSSSNISVATVSGTGVVAGLASGTSTITYAIGSCRVTTVVTVNTLPSAIAGSLFICNGNTSLLTSAPSGGTWTSASPLVATIGSSSGLVTAGGPGTSVITYSLGTGCTTSKIVTVNIVPSTITGTSTYCAGTTGTLSSSPSGGTWTSSNTALATVGTSSGFVTAVATGSPAITYTLSSGCYSTTILTINSVPAAITGAGVLCNGASTTWSDATPGGTWVSTLPAVAIIGSSSGIVTAFSAGITTITYALSSGCFATKDITVNGTPSPITGTMVYCVGETGTLGSTPSGGTWTSSNILQATVSPSGVITAIASGSPVVTYSFGTGCMTTATLTINPNPASITGLPTLCEGAITTLSDAATGGVWTSTSPTVAGIGSATGIVSGVLAGTSTISYTLPTGCFATTDVTVNGLPAPITGAASVCIGSTTTLSTTPSGGTWSSSNATMATVSASGVVSGISAGAPTITYILPTGCYVTKVVTVNPLPAAITGTLTLCPGGITALSDASTGGTWTSGTPSAATIGVSSGVVSGVSTGTSTITYTLATECQVTADVTVNSLPSAISGTMTVCVGATTTLSNISGSSTWSSSNTGIATVGATTGIVTGVSAGSVTITFTLPTGCYTTTVVTVNPLPAAIGGTMTVCEGGTAVLTDATSGGVWTSGSISLANIGSASGIVSGVSAGTPAITYTLGTGCAASATITVNPTPTAIAGTLSVCIGNTTALSSAPTGGTWVSSNTTQATVSGTGVVTGGSAGMPVITYTVPTGCSTMTTITVNPLPAAISGPGSVCVGSSVALSSATSGGTWSSSNSLQAAVGSATGVVTGAASGTPSIIYTLPTGCATSTVITVNANPSAITGTMTVCTGFTTTLSSTPSGGTWTSSNPSEATVISSTGDVTGVTAGVPMITYTDINGCFNTALVTVNQTPAAITGSNQVCVGSTTTLGDATTGGSWTSTNPSAATVGSATGVVFGVALGTSTISYIMPTGCNITLPITVNITPASISGPTQVCPGSTITLTNGTIGGTWTSSNISIATVGSTGVVTGVTSGMATISYTMATGCQTTYTITVNSAPSITSWTPPTAISPCIGGSSVVTVNSMSLGAGTFTITYDLSGANSSIGNTATLTMGAVSGIFAIPSTSLPSSGPTSATITSITNAVGCTTNLVSGNIASFVVNALPTAFTVTGGGSFCAGGSGVHVGLGGSQTGISYQLFLGASPVGGPLTGTSTALDFGLFTTAGTYTVVGTLISGGCTNAMAGSVTVTVNPLPTVFTVTGGGSYCAGGSGVPVGLSNSQTGVNYQLFNGTSAVGSPLAGTGTLLSFGLQTGSGSYSVVATSTAGCISTMSGAVSVSINPVPSPIGGPGSVCVGSTISLASTTTGGVWTGSSSLMVNVGSATGTVTGTGAGSPTITYALPSGCFTTIVITVNPLPAAISGSLSACVSTTVTLTDGSSGGSWASSNIAQAVIGSTSGAMTAVLAGNPTITYTLPTGCFVTAIASINAIPAAITGPNHICIGTSATLADATTGGTWTSSSPGLAPVGTTSGIISGVASGTLTITYTLSTGCFALYPVTVNPAPPAISGAGTVCVGSSISLTNGAIGGTWSSSNSAEASVIGSSGVVTGVNAGTPTISYTLTTGCFATMRITVNTAPASISGTSNICVGSSTALTNATTGGTWSSSGSAVSVGSTSGIAIGSSVGTANITYTVPGGCFTIFPMTVNAVPAAITGTLNVCVLSSTTLADATTGGTWTSGNPTMASIGGASGVVNGFAAGSPSITYTLATGCRATATITVNPLPASIAGASSVCTGASVTLTDATSGGTWSSSTPLQGSVGAATGIVTGNSVGTPFITYTLPTGCFATTAIVVNQTPSAISGTPFVCLGATTFLSNTFGGGIWSSSNSAIASVGSSTGAVTGNAIGTANIIYVLPGGCSATLNVTVNPTPAAITGTPVVCPGGTTTLADASGGGLWSSSNLFFASVGSTSGVVTGNSGGFALISYTLPGGCSASAFVTINPAPAAIAGPTGVCAGASITLTNTSSGGTWTSSNTSVATIGSVSGILNGIVAGSTVITYTLPTGCFITANGTVNPLPAAISGTAAVCIGATTALGNTSAGGSWSSSNLSVATVGTTSGIVSGVTAGNATITYTLPTGCLITRSVTVNALPGSFAVTGGGGFCPGSSGVHVGLSGSATGISYQLFAGTATSGSALSGTGSSLDFGLRTTAGTYTVVATNTATGCSSAMSGSVTVSGLTPPAAFSITGGGTYCVGGSGVHVGLFGSTSGVNYQLFNGTTPMGGALSGTGSSIDFGFMTLTGTYTVIATDPSSGCVATMTGSTSISTTPLPTPFTVTGGGIFCSGGTGLHVGLLSSTTGVSYQLFKDGVVLGSSVPGTGGSLDFGIFTGSGTYTVIGTSGAGCTVTMTGSVIISVVTPPGVFAMGGGGAYCAGSGGVGVTLAGSATGVNYQLLLGGSPVSAPMTGTGSSLNFGLQTAAGVYTAIAIDAITGCTSTMSGSASVTVNPLPVVAGITITGGGSYCSGGSVLIGLSGSQTGVSYRLTLSGSTITTVTGSGSAISFGPVSTLGTYTVVAVTTTGTCTVNLAGSTTVATYPTPTAYTVIGGGSYCSGGTGVIVGLGGSQTGVTYQLSNGSPVGSPVAGTGGPLNFGLQTTGGSYTVTATSSTGCTASMSGSVSVSVSSLPTPYTLSGGGSYCAGTGGILVGLSNSQSSVNYQLLIGGSPVGAPVAGSGGAISFGLQTSPGTYTVVATNATTGCVNNMTGSTAVSVTTLPTAFAITGGGSFCSGGAGVPVGLLGSQSSVNYQLYNGSAPAGLSVSGTGSAISFGLQTAGGTYTVIATSGATTCSATMPGSAVVIMNSAPNAYNMTGGGTYCSGTSGVHVGLNSSDAGISYQLMLGTSLAGAPMSGSGFSLDFGLKTLVGVYSVVATNTSTGCTNTMNGTDTVTSVSLPNVYTMTGGGSYCAGGTGRTVGLLGSQSGVTYQLYNGGVAAGIPVAGTGSAISFGIQTVAGTYTVVATGGSGCTSNMSGSVSIIVNSLPVVFTVTGGGSYCSGGAGVTIGLTGSQFGVNYQLYDGITPWSGPVAGTGGILSFGLIPASGSFTVIAANASTGCSSAMTGSVTITINSAPAPVPLTGGGGYCVGGPGVHIGLAGSAVGVNYQLYRGASAVGTPLAGAGTSIDFGLQTVTGAYTVIATNPATSCTSVMSGSVTVSINPLPSVFSITGGGSYCAGGSGVVIGLSGSVAGVSYQLMNGISTAGSPVTGTGAPMSFGLQTAGGTYTVVATIGTTGCSRTMTGSALITVNAAPTVYVMTGGGSYCAGGTGFHVGISGSTVGIRYQLHRGAATVGGSIAGTGIALDFGVMAVAGTYTVIATNTSTGCTQSMSSAATITVNPLPGDFAVTGGGTYCAGGTGVHVGLSGSAVGISYQLFRGGIAVGGSVSGTGSSIDFGLETIAGTYTVVATNPLTGCTRAMSGTATVSTNPAPTVYAVTGGGSYCSGPGNHIGLAGSQPGVHYRLYLFGAAVGSSVAGTGAAIDFGTFTSTGIYTAVATNSSTGCTSSMSGSATISAGALPTSYSVTGGGTLCSGGSGYSVGLSGSQSGVHYQLYRGTTMVGTPVSGTGGALSFGIMTTAGGYTVVATNSSTGCIRVMTGSATITVNPNPTISGSIYTVAPGANITLAGSPSGGLWVSSTPTKATIGSSSGVVHGVTLGTTTISYTLATGCRATHMVSVTPTGHRDGSDDSTASMMMTTGGSTIYVAPNPNRGTFTIKGSFATTNDLEVNIEITNMLGQVIYSHKTVAHSGDLDEAVELSKTIANGMYLLTVHSDQDNKVFHIVVER